MKKKINNKNEKNIMEMLKLVFLFIAVWFTLINTGRLISKQVISVNNIFIQAVGITGTIYLYTL